jgi:hypothetical protein
MERSGFRLAILGKAFSFFVHQAIQFTPAFTDSFAGSGLCLLVVIHVHSWLIKSLGSRLPTQTKNFQPNEEKSSGVRIT